MKLPLSMLGLVMILLPGAGHASADFRCADLVGARIEPAAIGLPTQGAVVTAADLHAADASGAYCLLTGEISSIDPQAQNIRFQLALPRQWNGKALMFGGGGLNGVIPAVTGNVRNAPVDAPTPLARGYAVFGSDSGHQASALPSPFAPDSGDFLRNDEQYRNFIGDALKKTHDVAMRLIALEFGRKPDRSYFFGSSKGGTEALLLATRWPADWDGIVALYPGRSFAVALLGQLAVTQALSTPGAYPSLAQRGMLHRAVIAACDKLDGLADGIISNVRRCNIVFDPATATVDGVPLRCPGGSGNGETCLSDRQIDALKKAGRPLRLDWLDEGDERSFAGFNILTSGLGASGNSPLEAATAAKSIGTTQATFPPSEGNSASAYFSDRFLRAAVTPDPDFNQLSLDLTNPGALTARLRALFAIDQVTTDLTAYHNRKGKLIIVHGTEDMLSSPRQIEAYYEAVEAKLGADKTRSFLRFYEVPGFGHNGSTIFNATFDQLAMLEHWVEQGVDPADDQQATDLTGAPGRTRPLCLYPAWPKYKGKGDPNDAGSFACAAN